MHEATSSKVKQISKDIVPENLQDTHTYMIDLYKNLNILNIQNVKYVHKHKQSLLPPVCNESRETLS